MDRNNNTSRSKSPGVNRPKSPHRQSSNTRPKSPSVSAQQKKSTTSVASGNNNRPRTKSPGPANATKTPQTQTHEKAQAQAQQDGGKLAREKFQSLLLTAKKLEEDSKSARASAPVPITWVPSEASSTPKIPTAAVMTQMDSNVSSAPGTTSLHGAIANANASVPYVPQLVQKNSSLPAPAPVTTNTPTPAATNATKPGSSGLQVQVTEQTKTLTAPTISASAKTSTPKNPPFPNLDPRTFPRTLGQQSAYTGNANNSINVNNFNSGGPKVLATKSMGGIDNRSRNLRTFVEKAMMEHKIFSCVGVYPAVKNALKKRGWVEKTGPINMIRSASSALPSLPKPGEDESDAQWIARNLRDYPPDFIWVIRRDNIDWKNMTKDQMINRFPKAWFTTKVGLVACLQQMHWFSESGFSETFFPRCYRLCLDDERQAFQEDYRLSACMSYLRYFVECFEAKGAGWLVDPQSRITPLSIDFASRQLGNYIRMRRHEDIDWLLPPNFMSQHWEAFIHQYYMVVHDKKKIRFESFESVKNKYEMAKKTLQRISQYWPQAHIDGVYNMWICKPGARSRGKGIVIMNTQEKILDLLNHGNVREANWVVQKYMERPMLIYKTKFDIRQWFIISDWSPLTLWFYKECYIRFCTKIFELENFHESIHLCNNAIQCRYQNAECRDAALPDENMWDCYTFQAYLKSIGKQDQWSKIYNGMKQAIIGVLLSSQENVESKKGCFELYGADFMLSEDCNPWLIEINSCPCMASTTSITARMCAQCLEDCVKVMIDRRSNKNADTGMFEMVYRQPLSAVTVTQFTGHDLIVQGKKLTRDVDWPGTISSKSNTARRSSAIVPTTMLTKSPVMQAQPENLTFSDLLHKLRMKNTHLFQGYVNANQNSTLLAMNTANDPALDRSLTSTLLSRMRALNSKVLENRDKDKAEGNNNNAIIPGMRTVYPKAITGPVRAVGQKGEGTLGHLSKYFDENTSTFANLVRIGKEISADENKENREKRPETFGPPGVIKRITAGSPYAPRAETAKTLDDVRLAVSQAATKFAVSRNSGGKQATMVLPPTPKTTPTVQAMLMKTRFN